MIPALRACLTKHLSRLNGLHHNRRAPAWALAILLALAPALLPTPDALTRAATQPRRWLLTGPRAESDTHADALARMGWHATYEDPRWTLWQSAPEGPEAAQHESLPGCHQQGRHQRGP